MTIAQLESKTQCFTASMSRSELCRVRDWIEEAIDARDAERIWRRVETGKEKTTPLEIVKARQEKRFAGVAG